MTKIGIIGTGNVGGNLGVRFAGAGYPVVFGARGDKDLSELLGRAGRSTKGSVQDAVSADVVFLAVPGNAAIEAVASLDLSGRVLVDCTNPLTWSAGPVWDPPEGGSNAAALAAKTGAKVVKGFNTFGAEFHLEPRGVSVFLAGDDAGAKELVSSIGTKAGFTMVDAGPLRNAGVLENVAMLWIHLAMVGGQGRDFMLNFVR